MQEQSSNVHCSVYFVTVEGRTESSPPVYPRYRSGWQTRMAAGTEYEPVSNGEGKQVVQPMKEERQEEAVGLKASLGLMQVKSEY